MRFHGHPIRSNVCGGGQFLWHFDTFNSELLVILKGNTSMFLRMPTSNKDVLPVFCFQIHIIFHSRFALSSNVSQLHAIEIDGSSSIIFLYIPVKLQTGKNSSRHAPKYSCYPFKLIHSMRPSDAYICVGKLTSISSDNGFSPEWHQTIISTNAGIWWFKRLGTNFKKT